MRPKPKAEDERHRGSGKLKGKLALISGGDSGIGRAVAIAFAKEGANISIVYLNEHKDAKATRELVENHGAECVLIAGNVGDEKFCQQAVKKTVRELGALDILVNNAAEQHPKTRSRRFPGNSWNGHFAPTFLHVFSDQGSDAVPARG
jgi:NAD(P)-dependent dehydrogenase (short-subunit alcohol dehydrogenase family)